jgi:hypothetical protein
VVEEIQKILYSTAEEPAAEAPAAAPSAVADPIAA